jgi:hypothetical protein
MQAPTLKALLGTLAIMACFTTLAQDRPEPERLRREARELMDKARNLKADGLTDAADKLARAAKDLALQAEEMQSKSSDEKNARINEEKGRDSRPDRERVDRSPRGSDETREIQRPDRPRRAPQDRFNRMDGLRRELAVRRYHIQKAIMHLRLAGLNEQADRLEERMHDAVRQFRERRKEDLLERRPSLPRPERPADREPRERP